MHFSDVSAERATIGLVVAGEFWKIPEKCLVPAEAFYDPSFRILYSAAVRIQSKGLPVCVESVNAYLVEHNLDKQLQAAIDPTKSVSWQCWSHDPDFSWSHSPGVAPIEWGLDTIREYYHNREIVRIGNDLAQGNLDAATAAKSLSQYAGNGSNGSFDWNRARSDRRFDITKLYDEPTAVLCLAGQTISTQGNLTSIFAQAKAGKSAVVGAIVGALVSPGGEGDFLGWSSSLNLEEAAIVHFDTEQSRYDHQQIVLTALKRAGLNEPPPWLHSYCLTDLPVKDRLQAIERELERCAKAHKAILAVLLDGLGDFVLDVNDAEESNNLVAHLHALAIKYAMVFIQVLHENPGSDPSNTNKMRGHLGSQMERKSESNVRLVKDKDDVTTQYTGKSRHASIPQERGVQFAYSPTEAMHVTIVAQDKKGITAEEREFVAEIYKGTIGGLDYGDSLQKVIKITHLTPSGAEKRFLKLRSKGAIVKNKAGFYCEPTT